MEERRLPQNTTAINIMLRQMKAKQLNVREEDLVESHIDGKRKLTVKDECPTNSKKRFRQRSVRGVGSVIDEINFRLSDAELLIKDLESKGSIVGMESYDLLDQLCAIAEKVETTIHPLLEMEEEIEHKKNSIDNYHKYLKTTIAIHKMRQMGDIQSAEKIENNQGSDYRKFRLVYRSITPMLNQARVLRLTLLKEKRRLLNLQYNLMRRFLRWQVEEVIALIQSGSCDPSQSEQYLLTLKPWSMISEFPLSILKKEISSTEQIAVLETDIDKLLDQVDDALPTTSELINKIHLLLDK